MNQRAIEKTELNKILSLVAEYAVLEGSKELLENTEPASELLETKNRLRLTEESRELLFVRGVSKIEYFPPFSDELQRAKKNSALSCGELLKTENLLRSARIAHTGINALSDDSIVMLKELADKLYFDANLEDDIRTKILSDTEISDYASDKLYSFRR